MFFNLLVASVNEPAFYIVFVAIALIGFFCVAAGKIIKQGKLINLGFVLIGVVIFLLFVWSIISLCLTRSVLSPF